MNTLIETRSDTEVYKLPENSLYRFKDIEFNDPRVWKLYSDGLTTGIFQFESSIGKQWMKNLQPRNIDDLAAAVSLIRPGGIESKMLEKFCKIKNGEEEPSYIHESLKPILNVTHSCLVFQEQILRICIEIAGFNEIQGDDCRRAIGKKLPEEMVKVKKMFMEGCEKKAIVPTEIAEEMFGWIQKSVRFLFNAGHSYSYAYTSYYTAYQKVHFPTEFYCSWLTFANEKMDPKAEIAGLIQDCRISDVKVLPPDIRHLNKDFKIIKDKEIVFGLSHIRGIGNSSINNIIDNCGKATTFIEFLKLVKKIKRSVAESLVKSGGCDHFGMSRTAMLRHIYVIYGRGKDNEEIGAAETKELTPNELTQFFEFIKNSSGKIDDCIIVEALKSIIETESCVKKRIPTILSKIEYMKTLPSDSNTSCSLWEKLYLGCSLTSSKADDYEKSMGIKTCLQAIKSEAKEKMTLHVVIDEVTKCKTSEKSKNPGAEYARLIVSDVTSRLDSVVCWPQTYEKLKQDLIVDSVIECYAYKDNWGGREQHVINGLKVLG